MIAYGQPLTYEWCGYRQDSRTTRFCLGTYSNYLSASTEERDGASEPESGDSVGLGFGSSVGSVVGSGVGSGFTVGEGLTVGSGVGSGFWVGSMDGFSGAVGDTVGLLVGVSLFPELEFVLLLPLVPCVSVEAFVLYSLGL